MPLDSHLLAESMELLLEGQDWCPGQVPGVSGAAMFPYAPMWKEKMQLVPSLGPVHLLVSANLWDRQLGPIWQGGIEMGRVRCMGVSDAGGRGLFLRRSRG